MKKFLMGALVVLLATFFALAPLAAREQRERWRVHVDRDVRRALDDTRWQRTDRVFRAERLARPFQRFDERIQNRIRQRINRQIHADINSRIHDRLQFRLRDRIHDRIQSRIDHGIERRLRLQDRIEQRLEQRLERMHRLNRDRWDRRERFDRYPY